MNVTMPASPQAERRTALVRLLILSGLLPLLWWDVISPEGEIAVTALSLLIIAYIVATVFLLPRLRVAPRQDLFQTIDILTASALIYFTGGINSSLLVLLYLPVIAAALRFDLRHTFLSAIAVSAIVLWMWSMAEGGLRSLGPVTLRVGMFTLGSLLLAFFFGLLAQETRLSQARADLNRALNEKLAAATDKLRRRLAELEASYGLARRLAAATDSPSILEAVADTAKRQMDAPFSAVFLRDAAGTLSLAHARGIGPLEVGPVLEACLARLPADGGGAFVLDIPDRHAAWQRAVCAPMTTGQKLVGLLCAGGSDLWQAPEDAPSTLLSVADQGGVSLERASLLEDLQRLALADPAARLTTRDQFDRILREEVKRTAQLGATFALLKIWIPRIGEQVVQREHTADLLHRRAAAVILDGARRIDVVAEGTRGEFFVMLAMTNADAAERFGERIVQQLRTDATAARLLSAGAGLESRIGIAMFPDDAVTGAELHDAAQRALAAVTSDRGSGKTR